MTSKQTIRYFANTGLTVGLIYTVLFLPGGAFITVLLRQSLSLPPPYDNLLFVGLFGGSILQFVVIMTLFCLAGMLVSIIEQRTRHISRNVLQLYSTIIFGSSPLLLLLLHLQIDIGFEVLLPMYLPIVIAVCVVNWRYWTVLEPIEKKKKRGEV